MYWFCYLVISPLIPLQNQYYNNQPEWFDDEGVSIDKEEKNELKGNSMVTIVATKENSRVMKFEIPLFEKGMDHVCDLFCDFSLSALIFPQTRFLHQSPTHFV